MFTVIAAAVYLGASHVCICISVPSSQFSDIEALARSVWEKAADRASSDNQLQQPKILSIPKDAGPWLNWRRHQLDYASWTDGQRVSIGPFRRLRSLIQNCAPLVGRLVALICGWPRDIDVTLPTEPRRKMAPVVCVQWPEFSRGVTGACGSLKK